MPGPPRANGIVQIHCGRCTGGARSHAIGWVTRSPRGGFLLSMAPRTDRNVHEVEAVDAVELTITEAANEGINIDADEYRARHLQPSWRTIGGWDTTFRLITDRHEWNLICPIHDSTPITVAELLAACQQYKLSGKVQHRATSAL